MPVLSLLITYSVINSYSYEILLLSKTSFPNLLKVLVYTFFTLPLVNNVAATFPIILSATTAPFKPFSSSFNILTISITLLLK